MKGGKRPNAGRPKGEPTTTIAFRVKTKHVEELKHKIKQLIKLQILELTTVEKSIDL